MTRNNGVAEGETNVRPVAVPSRKRYRNLTRDPGNVSLTRSLQYETLAAAAIDGRVLDVGGGDLADYRGHIGYETYESVNIDAAMRPTWVVKEGCAFPCESGRYTNVISLNTLEHIYEPRSVVDEAYRALVSGGRIHLWTPFLFPIHAHPDDFFRFTESWFQRVLTEVGFGDVTVRPLSWGVWSAGKSCSGMLGPFKKQRLRWAMELDWLTYSYKRLRGREQEFARLIAKYPLAYYASARKI